MFKVNFIIIVNSVVKFEHITVGWDVSLYLQRNLTRLRCFTVVTNLTNLGSSFRSVT